MNKGDINPFARQLHKDMTNLSNLESAKEFADAWTLHNFSYIKLLEDEELWALFLLIDIRVMRECTFYTEWAPPDCLKHAVAPE